MTWVKVCGLTRPEDVEAAVEVGADALGFVVAPGTPRAVTAEEAHRLGKNAPAVRVLVSVDLSPGELLLTARQAGVDAVQPHGRQAQAAAAVAAATGYLVLRPVAMRPAVSVEDVPANQIPLLDTPHDHLHGGTGERFAWELAPSDRRFVLAGGLGPEVVGEAVERLRPWGVDASSSLESAPGIKDHARLRAFVETAKGG